MIQVALAGNPNCGKTTLFNYLTGANHYVGNWAGVTVEKREGHLKHKDVKINIVDLPGIYSLSPYSIEEKVARNYIVDDQPDVIVNIVDATYLERNLFLSTQLLEMKKPMVIALNMMDEAEKKGIKVNIAELSKRLGVPVIPIIALKGDGISELLDEILSLNKSKRINDFKIEYSKALEVEIESSIEKYSDQIPNHLPKRWVALKYLENDEEILERLSLEEHEHDHEEDVISGKYTYISNLLSQIVVMPKNEEDMTDKVDNFLLNQWIGVPIFLAIMAGIFKLTFDIGGYFADYLDVLFNEVIGGAVSTLFNTLGVEMWLQSLVIDGIIGGVGGVLTFVPNIAILFFAITLLEDSGYMARVAYIMDRWMSKVGLSGKTFIPMILGFGCNVPAIMATRTLEDENDRLLAILINPFMSCGARLPVYVLFSAAFFPGNEFLVTFSLYTLGVVIAITMAFIFRRTLFRGEESHFILELPPYRIPSLKMLWTHVWERVRGYIVKAGTVIFAASIILWFVLNFNITGMSDLTNSFGAGIGKALVPFFKPLGFGSWQAALSLLTGVVAKEIVVANMLIVYGLGDGASATQFAQVLQGSFSQLSAYAFLVFVLLYTPCVGVIGVIKRETNSWKWTFFSVFYQLGIAWFVALLVYQIGSLFI